MHIFSSTSGVVEGLPVAFRDQAGIVPGGFEDSYMLEYDFDETCFTTLTSSGKGPEVREAYEIAVRSVLGDSAVRDFNNQGGLSNRAPLDVIQGLVSVEPSLVHNALEHAIEHYAHPSDMRGFGLIAQFLDRSKVEPDELAIRAITEMLVIKKKEVLIPQISPEWPKSVNGFDEHWDELGLRRAEEGQWKGVHTAIVSSGHTDFIQKTLEAAGLPQPDVYMTDDEMRRQVNPRTKPDPYALELVRNAWFNAYVVPENVRASEYAVETAKKRQVYIGDDKEKDGRMATNDGIAFLHHDGGKNTWEVIGGQIAEAVEGRAGFGAE